MKVMVIIKASKSSEAGEMPGEQLLTDMGSFNEELVKAGVLLDGAGLHPSSRGTRVHFSGTNRTVVDGPFAETKELIAGFWIWRVPTMAEAIEWVKRCPNPMPEASEIEIRPLFDADDFGESLTPELREQEASVLAQTMGLGVPRFEDGRELLIAGFSHTYTCETRMRIPELWQRFAPHIGHVPGQLGGIVSYGVCLNAKPDGSFEYMAGVEVSSPSGLSHEFSSIRLSSQRYAVFTHAAHISTIANTIDTIWTKWVPDAAVKPAMAPCFERYTEHFDPQTGMGGIEIWIPVLP